MTAPSKSGQTLDPKDLKEGLSVRFNTVRIWPDGHENHSGQSGVITEVMHDLGVEPNLHTILNVKVGNCFHNAFCLQLAYP